LGDLVQRLVAVEDVGQIEDLELLDTERTELGQRRRQQVHGTELQRLHLLLVLVEGTVRVHLDLDRAAGVFLGELLEFFGSLALGRVLRHHVAELDHDGVCGDRCSRQTHGNQTDQKRTDLHESISSERTASR
jgi:hypothetical protein